MANSEVVDIRSEFPNPLSMRVKIRPGLLWLRKAPHLVVWWILGDPNISANERPHHRLLPSHTHSTAPVGQKIQTNRFSFSYLQFGWNIHLHHTNIVFPQIQRAVKTNGRTCIKNIIWIFKISESYGWMLMLSNLLRNYTLINIECKWWCIQLNTKLMIKLAVYLLRQIHVCSCAK